MVLDYITAKVEAASECRTQLNLGRALIRTAQEKAAAELEKAKIDAAVLRDEAHSAGFTAGIELVKGELAALQAAQADWLKRSSEEIVAIAVSIAREVVGNELQTAPQSIVNRVLRGVRELERERELSLHIHPTDVSRLKPIQEKLLSQKITVVPDSTVCAGGVSFISPQGSWDLDPYDHLRRVMEMLRNRREVV